MIISRIDAPGGASIGRCPEATRQCARACSSAVQAAPRLIWHDRKNDEA
jgi:hypothetical protein